MSAEVTNYLDRQMLETVIGQQALMIAASDGERAIDEPRVESAIADINGRIDAQLLNRYALPLTVVPGFLTRAAARLVHAELVDEASASELIVDRARAAWRLVMQVGHGGLRLGTSVATTSRGQAQVINLRGRRQFRRRQTAGLV